MGALGFLAPMSLAGQSAQCLRFVFLNVFHARFRCVPRRKKAALQLILHV